MSPKPTILVVGSINMDLVVRTPRMPEPGETVLGSGFKTTPGGKGANQAVAAARLGGNCRMIGLLGEDAFGEGLLAGLKAEGVECTHVGQRPNESTGVAMIVVDANGENSIVVASGANHKLTPDDIYSSEEAFKGADVVVLQLELTLPTVRAAIDLGRRHGARIILDPAPAVRAMHKELFQVDIISPNASEAEILTGRRAMEERVDKQVVSELIGQGAKAVVLKLGARGCLVGMADGHFYKVPTYDVEVVDTTAAGDAFTAALAVAVGRGENMHLAAKFATAAGALACTKFGAQSAMPTADEVAMIMNDQAI
ncbi:MAG TPA: ribokinase [Phycisphaerae bacterium]|nr:ribokinase [Phycisphaerae bacterium]